MALPQSLDEHKLIAAIIRDVFRRHGLGPIALKHTLNRVSSRIASEGLGFLTKTLPKLGKAFDKALSAEASLNCNDLRLKPLGQSKLPKLFGELFSKVLAPDGSLLPNADVNYVISIRQITLMFYKYELPCTADLDEKVIQKFVRTENDLEASDNKLRFVSALSTAVIRTKPTVPLDGTFDQVWIAKKARRSLQRLFMSFDPRDIYPRHGPGAVATKQRLWSKYEWTNVSEKITNVYPLDEYFYASLGHVCDRLDSLQSIETKSLPARVILVPKDSRGQRLISCEPVDFQWIQQGLGRAITQYVEKHPLTKWNVFFTNQQPNQYGALLGSKTGGYATLDLNEASDRVSLELVRLLFPEHVYTYLEACRTSATELPNGTILPLRKYAPMGSCLCFPVLALTVWALLNAGARDKDTRESILVYGDDVIVPTAYAEDAMSILESFGLKVNRDKSCIKGSFRESCGTDAFKGTRVTPVRIRTVWSSTRSPEQYASYISYSNDLLELGYHEASDVIASELCRIYGPIPTIEQVGKSAPSLRRLPLNAKEVKTRWNYNLQKREYSVLCLTSPEVNKTIDGWSMLLRYFAERANDLNRSAIHSLRDYDVLERIEMSIIGSCPFDRTSVSAAWNRLVDGDTLFSVGSYTRRGTSMLVRRWR